MDISSQARSRAVFTYFADNFDYANCILDPCNMFDINTNDPHVVRDKITGRDIGLIYYCRKTDCVRCLTPRNPKKFSKIPDLSLEHYNIPYQLPDGRVVYWSGNKIRRKERLSSFLECC